MIEIIIYGIVAVITGWRLYRMGEESGKVEGYWTGYHQAANEFAKPASEQQKLMVDELCHKGRGR